MVYYVLNHLFYGPCPSCRLTNRRLYFWTGSVPVTRLNTKLVPTQLSLVGKSRAWQSPIPERNCFVFDKASKINPITSCFTHFCLFYATIFRESGRRRLRCLIYTVASIGNVTGVSEQLTAFNKQDINSQKFYCVDREVRVRTGLFVRSMWNKQTRTKRR